MSDENRWGSDDERQRRYQQDDWRERGESGDYGRYGSSSGYDHSHGGRGDYGRAYGGGDRDSYGGGAYGRGSVGSDRGTYEYDSRFGGGDEDRGFGRGPRSSRDFGDYQGGHSSRGWDRQTVAAGGPEAYGHSGWGGGGRGGRGLFARARDEVASWFGDDDERYRRTQAGEHRGRGPKGYTRSDDRIREHVCDALTDDAHVDASDIDVAVENGEVTLNGTVDSRDAKRRAEDCVDHLSGVKHVQNNLRVQQREWGAGGATTGAGGFSGASSAIGDGTQRRAVSGGSGTVAGKTSTDAT